MPLYEIESKNCINLFQGFMDLSGSTHTFKP